VATLRMLDLATTLDEAFAGLPDCVDVPTASAVLDRLALNLSAAREVLGATAWRAAVSIARTHALREVLFEDPLTCRSFQQPRGYQGDAELIDLIYEGEPGLFGMKPTTTRGAAIYSWSHQGKAPSAVRQRRKFLGCYLDREAARFRHPRALSVACGHLREVECSEAFYAGHFGEIVGIDQDPLTIATATARHSRTCAKFRRAGVQSLLTGRESQGRYDVIWSAGLFDYLDDDIARLLVRHLFSMLARTGVLVIANFLPDIPDVGYMELFMDWWLNYRSQEELQRLVLGIDHDNLASVDFVDDGQSHVGYLIVRRT